MTLFKFNVFITRSSFKNKKFLSFLISNNNDARFQPQENATIESLNPKNVLQEYLKMHPLVLSSKV
jgi:hypothetical protein